MIEISNRKANDYQIEETLDAGIILVGREVKSCVLREADMTSSYVVIRDKPILVGSYIKSNQDQFSTPFEPTRDRSLLITKAEIRFLRDRIKKGFSVICIKMFSAENGKIKVRLGVGRPIKKFDKRSVEIKKEHQREMKV